ncbi:hypothetical protein L226DRAFT_349881 [Lentinus tigrinus ALCF2SS1-7]|uniref:Uncharacterized protein n=1 Tax=Lentinus tigrinus ALCF2SS1-6 TaxID=1328759 RepID=A0A5C2RWJ1_9APHY|nr:hypothetical protein L227DRAFT_657400 [Lentinus tigrinus ALCF2SS1-6]RPD76756.1 hypothetical protein L226DRAFT_349881 [Lentinus tigrinus ALCF2SS1-7]
MAASNVTVDDASPLVLYEPADAWAHTSGSGAQSYGDSTFSSAQSEGATAKFSFSGTGFWVYGATKPDYGQYILMLDSQVMLYANATSDQPQFGQVLGGSSGLADGKHEVVLMAAGGGLVDIDAIMYETTEQQPISGSSASSGTQTASASSSSQSVARISANPNGKIDGSNGKASDQATSSSSLSPSSATSAPAASSTSVQLAAQPTAQPNAQPNAQPGDQSSQGSGQTSSQATTQPNARPNASAGAAPPSSSSLSQSQSASSTANFLSPTISQAQSAGNSPIAGTTKAQHGLPTGAIVGIAIGVAVGLLVLVALILLFLRRRRAKARRHAEVALPSPVLPLQNPDTRGSYFFGGYGNDSGPGNPTRDQYLARSPPAMAQAPSPAVTRTRGSELLPSSTFRDSGSSYTETATLVSESGTNVSLKTGPARPTRPPELHLDV